MRTSGAPVGFRRLIHLLLVAVSATITVGAAVVVGLAIPELLADPKTAEPVLLITVLVQPVWLVSIAGVAVLLNWRQPTNRIGWLFGVLGPLLGFIIGVWSYRWPIPSGWEIEYAWLSTSMSFYVVALAGPGLALLFPDGRLLSPGWRTPVALVTSAFLISSLLVGLAPGYLESAMPPGAAGQLDAERLAGFGVDALAPFGEVLNLTAFASLVVLLGMGVAGLIVRGWRGGPVVRAQLRWFLVAASLILIGIASSIIESTITPDTETTIGVLLLFAGFVLTPIAVAIAILRYRLYDIDVIIRRTLVYGTLTIALGMLYAASILLLQAALAPIIQGQSLAVAVSTLAVAALFQPVRRRVQRGVDRRFYRSRYDAQRTLEAFAARMRDELELDTLTDELRDVAEATMQPHSISVWLRRP